MRATQNLNRVRPAGNPDSAVILSRGGSPAPGVIPPQPSFPPPPLRLYAPPPAVHSALSSLRGESIVLVVDDANLAISFREQAGMMLDYGRLLGALRREAGTLDAHIIVTGITLEQHQRAETLAGIGYQVHCVPHLNVDVSVGFVLGRLSVGSADPGVVWAIGSGDGELGLCLAGALHDTLQRPRIVTLSVRHSTASALRQCPLITQNLYLGCDLAASPSC